MKITFFLLISLFLANTAFAYDCTWEERSSRVAEKVWETENCTILKYNEENLGVNVTKPRELCDAYEGNLTHSLRFNFGTKVVDDYYLGLYLDKYYIEKKLPRGQIKDDYFVDYCLECALKLPLEAKEMFGGYLDIVKKLKK